MRDKSYYNNVIQARVWYDGNCWCVHREDNYIQIPIQVIAQLRYRTSLGSPREWLETYFKKDPSNNHISLDALYRKLLSDLDMVEWYNSDSTTATTSTLDRRYMMASSATNYDDMYVRDSIGSRPRYNYSWHKPKPKPKKIKLVKPNKDELDEVFF